MTGPAIVIRGLAKSYPAVRGFSALARSPRTSGRVPALVDVSLEAGAGEVLGLLGPNGAGKTTLIEILATLLLPDTGSASVCGYDVVREPRQVRSSIGYAPSDTGTLYPRLTGAGNLRFFAVLREVESGRIGPRVAELFELVGLTRARDDRFERYSDGMKARLSLARALLADPPVLLLDEPTKSLDPLLQIEIREFMRDTLARALGKTVLLITHSLEEAAAVCDRVAILHEGRVVHVGPPGERGGQDLAAAFSRVVGQGQGHGQGRRDRTL